MSEKRQPVEATVVGGEWQHALADAWVGWLQPVLILAAAGLVAAVYLFDWLSEPAYARLLVVVYAAVVALGPTVQATLLSPRRLAALPALLGLLWAAVFVLPVWWTLDPGEPIAAGPLLAGQELHIEAAPAARLTVRIDGDLEKLDTKKEDRKLAYTLTAETGEKKSRLKGEFSQKKVGKRQRGPKGPDDRPTLVDAADLHTIDVEEGEALTLRLSHTKPVFEAPLHVALYAGAVPWTAILMGLAVALLLAIPFAARWLPREQRNFLPHVGAVAVVFVLAVQNVLDPVAPVKPLFGALLIALFAGVVIGEILGFIARRVIPPS